MIPGEYETPLKIYQGDTFLGPTFTLPNLSPFDGPSDLVGAEVTAQARAKESSTEVIVTFTVERIDDAAREVRLTLTPAQTAPIVAKKGVWDLQVAKDEWIGTPIRGTVEFPREVTR